MLHDVLHRLYGLKRNRLGGRLEAHIVSKEDRSRLLIDRLLPLLELLVRPQTGGNLKICDALRIPGVEDAVLAVAELAVVREEFVDLRRLEGFAVKFDGIAGDVAQADAADG